MIQIQVKEMRDHLKELLDNVLQGNEVVIVRRNEPIARIIPYSLESMLPSMAEFRDTIKIKGTLSKSLSEERGGTRF